MAKIILIVDDDPTMIKLVGTILKKEGFIVETAYDGLDALAKLKKINPDLIILDVIMPEINGYDVCYQLRFNKEFEKIPIILLTERSQEIVDDIGQKVNIAYIQKPLDQKILLNQIHQLISA
ncbi:MAG: response regulator [Candidatus Omnitrophica bacterium]|nr:response regulator [Candidatus Omnitrophota bacterium]MCB9747426.1 response regulator [Candidatus Omnitrophota bacterium]